MYSKEDQAKDEYELALYQAGKKATEFVTGYFESSSRLSDTEMFRANLAIKLLAVIQGVPLPVDENSDHAQ